MEGFDIIEAEDGYAGLDESRKAEPSLVVLDINMPGIDGFETLRRLREFSHVPVLMLSVRSAEMDRVLGLTAGADSYLAKPFSAAELLARVHALLRRQRVMQARRTPRPPGGGAHAPV